MYKINDTPENFYLGNGSIIYRNDIEIEHPYNLNNANVYFEKTTKIYKHGEQKQYDSWFGARLEFMDKMEIDNFLDYHFSFTAYKEKFLLYIDRIIIPDYMHNQDAKRIQIVKDWINKKRKRIDKIKEPLTFRKLFRDPDNAQKVKGILKTHGYVDENYNWIFEGNLNTIGAIFYYLRNESYGLSLIYPGQDKPQLTAFCKEFGLSVVYKLADKLTERLYKTLKSQKNFITDSDLEKNLVEMFDSFIKSK